MAVPLIKYPLDLTGTAPSNLITGEPHDLSNLSQKAFLLNYGPFYVNSLVVRNKANGAILTPKTQYVATQMFTDMTLRTAKDICSVIVITDKTLPANLQVTVDAQMLGGEYSTSVDAVQQMIDALDLGNQPVKWLDVLGRPIQFPPAPHYHDLGDVYGFEYMTAALERIVQAIYVGDEAQLAAIYQYIDHEIGVVAAQTGTIASNLTAHLVDYTNPHNVTKLQVGLGNVDNFATASNAQAIAGVMSTLFMTPANTAAVVNPITTSLNGHIANTGNPHNVTKTQVGLSNVPNYGVATALQAQSGTLDTAFMTPASTSAAITALALTPLNAHTTNTGNPHNVTKAQVGLSNVDNFATASNAQGLAGTSTVLFMTPASTAAAIQGQAGTALAAHVANTSNPHNVTAAQVGAYTKAQSDASLNAATSGLQTQINGKQNTLGFVPVQQGGGIGQLSNKVYLGHSAQGPRITVDSTDFGPLSLLGHQHNVVDVVGLQPALDSKATIGSSPRFSAMFVGADTDVYLYEVTAGSLGLRTGSAGAYKYTSFGANGDLSVGNGAVYAANGFQPSDRNLKKRIRKQKARALWRSFDFKTWLWKADDRPGQGAISQDIEKVAPEYTSYYDTEERKNVLAIDKASLSFEMAIAAGNEVDILRKQVDKLTAQVKALSKRR